MKIGIDVRLWRETGIGRYTRNLVVNLIKLDNTNEYILFCKSENKSSIEKMIAGYSNFSLKVADISWHGLSEQIKFPFLLNSAKLDLVHFPYFSVPVLYRGAYVVTVHDLIINSHKTGRASTHPYPIYLAKRLGYSAVLANALAHAKKVIVPSNSVKEDLKATYKNINSRKIEPIYEGGFEDKAKLVAQNSKFIEGRYILRVGNFYPHKNIERLIDAFRDLLFDNYENHDLKLVLAGRRDFFYKKIESKIDNEMLSENVVLVESPKDDTLINLYQNAALTVIPSLKEGFSLTGVEALSCGSLLLASDIPVHREIFEKAAIYCNPYDARDIKQKIDFMLEMSEKEGHELKKQGIKQSQKYSWQKMAKETLAVYESVNN